MSRLGSGVATTRFSLATKWHKDQDVLLDRNGLNMAADMERHQ